MMTGYEMYQLPRDHIKFLNKFLSELMEVYVLDQKLCHGRELILADRHMERFITRLSELERIHDIQNCDIFLPNLGTYIDSGEFLARDYNEGQWHKVVLFLFGAGLLMTTLHKGLLSQFQQPILKYDSLYSFDMIDLDVAQNFIRLKDVPSGKTTYKIQQNKPKQRGNMSAFLEKIASFKKALDQKIPRLNELNGECCDREAVNIGLARRNLRNYANKGPGTNDTYTYM